MIGITSLFWLASLGAATSGPQGFERDTIETSAGPLEITFVGHGSLIFSVAGRLVYVDPVMREADYRLLPDADLILVTHRHGDHLDSAAIAALTKPGTEVVVAQDCAGAVDGAVVMRNGDRRTLQGFPVEAVPAYNVEHKRDGGEPYHPKGDGNGYVVTFGDTRVYVAGDTEDVPEMKALRNVDVAFLPMNLPYTMTPAMVANAARAFRPGILYPYHYGNTDVSQLVALLRDEPGIEVRIRQLQ